ncbi:hypothetical protein Tco_0379647 [Tanacetum coccineum]
MKILINCPLKQAFTKCPSVLYPNYLKEFWSTAISYDPSPPIDDLVARPLKEFLIKFSVMNGSKCLILDFKTFCSSTGLDYNKGKYVDHPSHEAVKIKLRKIVTNVLGENYSSTKQISFIQQMIAYCHITETKVDIREIIYSDLVTKLLNKTRLKYVSYPRFISCALEELLGSEYTQNKKFGNLPSILSNSNFLKYPSKVTDIELTGYIVAVNNQKDLVSPLLVNDYYKHVVSKHL